MWKIFRKPFEIYREITLTFDMKKLDKVKSITVRDNFAYGNLHILRMPCDISAFTRSFWEWSLRATSRRS